MPGQRRKQEGPRGLLAVGGSRQRERSGASGVDAGPLGSHAATNDYIGAATKNVADAHTCPDGPGLDRPNRVRTPTSEIDDVVAAERPITVLDLLTSRAGYGFPSDCTLPQLMRDFWQATAEV